MDAKENPITEKGRRKLGLAGKINDEENREAPRKHRLWQKMREINHRLEQKFAEGLEEEVRKPYR